MSEDASFKAGIFAKRAGTNLVLGRCDAAKSDALASRTGATSDWKAYYTAGKSAYGLRDYGESKKYYESALEINPGGSGIKQEHARCVARLEEEEKGNYDFRAIYASLSPQKVHVDCASFLANTKVASSPLHGNGLYAARDLKAGDVVFVEKALFMPNQYEPSRASAALYTAMVHKLYDNPSLGERVLRLYDGGFKRTGAEGTIVDGVPVVDVFVLEGIRTKNCFSAPLSTFEDTKPSSHKHSRMAKGLWAHSSYMNHSCVPNTMRSFLGDLLISRATRDIQAGEEIFQQYVPVKALLDARLATYREGWGFECQCQLCDGERKTMGTLERRKEVLAEIEKVRYKKHPSKGIVADSVIRGVERKQKQLEDLHEPGVFEHLPRLALVYSNNYLAEAYSMKKNHVKVVRYSLKLLRNFGFDAPEEEDPLLDWEPNRIFDKSEMVPLMTIHVVTTLRTLAESYRALGREDMGRRCEETAGFGYLLVSGFETDANKLDDE